MKEKGIDTNHNEAITQNFVVTISDFISILRANKKRIQFCVVCFALLAFYTAVTRPIKYETKALFHQKGRSSVGFSPESFQSILSVAQPESEGIIAMKSHRLNKQLTKTHSLQASISKDELEFPYLPISTIINNIKLEIALWNGSPFPVVQNRAPSVVAKNVVYDEIVPLGMEMKVISDQEYILKKGKQTFYGIFGTPLETDDFTIVLEFQGDSKKDLGNYILVLQPLDKVAEHIQKSFTIASDTLDKNLIKISYSHHDKKAVVDHINSLMSLYQDYLNDEHKRISASQLDYLRNRQQTMGSQLKEMMNAYANALSSDLSTTGFSSTQKAMEFLAGNQQSLKQKLMSLELEIQRLESVNTDQLSNVDKFLSLGSSDWAARTIAEMRSLKQQADSLSLALRGSPMALNSYQDSFDTQLTKLDEVKHNTQEAQKMLISLNQGNLPDSSFKLMQNPQFIVKAWYDRLVAAKDHPHEWQKGKEGFSSYLTHLLEYMQVYQRNIEERLNHQQSFQSEFQGISPNTAKELYIAYVRELNEKESKALKLQYIIGHLEDPHFEISSLSTVLDDPISGEMIGKATNTTLALKDTENRSAKEQDRLRADLELQKSFLSSHIKQSIELLKLNQKLLNEKIYSLQSINLSLLQNEMSVLEQQLKQHIQSSIDAYKREKLLLEQNLGEIRMEMARLPQKWAAEQLIDQQMAMNRNMTEEVSRLVESKNISNNLEKVQSGPLDYPVTPVHPRSPRILFLTFIGAFFGLFLGCLWAIGSSVIHGIKGSLANLKAMGNHVSGQLSLECKIPSSQLLDSDLQTLRHVYSFINDGKTENCLLLACGKGPKYAPVLADLIAKSGQKVLIVDVDFTNATKEEGVLQYVNNGSKQVSVHNEGSYDFVCSGGIYRYASELFANSRFKEMIQELQQKYDWVIVSTNGTIDSCEVENLLNICNKTAMTLSGETLQSLSRPLAIIKDRNIKATFLS